MGSNGKPRRCLLHPAGLRDVEEINGSWLPRKPFPGDDPRANRRKWWGKRMRLPENRWKRAAHCKVQRAGGRGSMDRRGGQGDKCLCQNELGNMDFSWWPAWIRTRGQRWRSGIAESLFCLFSLHRERVSDWKEENEQWSEPKWKPRQAQREIQVLKRS